MRRDSLHDILLHGVKSEIDYETTIETFDARADGVDVTFSNPAHNGFFDLVVSAEGIYSKLRQLHYSNEETTIEHNLPNWRFLVEYHNHGMQPVYMVDRSETFLAYPLSPDAVYCYGHVYDDTRKYDNGNPQDHLRDLFGGRWRSEKSSGSHG